MDLKQRFAVSYGFMSIGICFIKFNMEIQGGNWPSNPAWRLVVSIYTLFKWSWWLILGCVLIGLMCVAIFEIVARLSEQKRLRELSVRESQRAIIQAIEREQRAVKAKEEEAMQELQKKKEDEERDRKIKEYRESLKRRTPQDAVELALENMCKGGS